jgi:hypothetical protein
MDRNEVVRRLVAGATLNEDERRALGPSVTRDELGVAIAQLLHQCGRFPLDGEYPSGLQLVVGPYGVRVVSHRRAQPQAASVTSLERAVDRYIDEEFGPSCRGVRIVASSPRPPRT